MTPDELLCRRMANQCLAIPEPGGPADLVTHLGAVQSQDYGPSLWAVAQRAGAGSVADVEAEIERGAILRTWPMRGTIHMVPAADARWMVELLAGRPAGQARGTHDKIGLTDAVFARSAEIVSAALATHQRIRRTDLYQILTERGVDCSASPHGSRGGHILGYLARSGLICLGPLDGRQATFVLLDDWVPASRRPADPAAELAVRYFTGHGPATARDFSWWSGMTSAEVRQSVERADRALTAVELDGTTYWQAAVRPDAGGGLEGAYLLPAFDEYTVGYADRTPLLGDHQVPGGELLNPVMVLDGRVVGMWKATVARQEVQIKLAPFDQGAVGVEFHDAAHRYADFLGRRAVITLTPVHEVRRMRLG